MIKPTNLANVGSTLVLGIMLSGCFHNQNCISTSGLAPIPPSQQFTIDDVLFRAAVLPDGSPTNISVEDYTLPIPDGKNDIKVGWSQTNASAAEYARMEFPQPAFPNGVDNLVVSGFHYNSFSVEAYDQAGSSLGRVDATSQQRVGQDLTVPGSGIARADIIGAEIGITNVCY